MTIIQADNKIRKVESTGDEISLIIEELDRQPHNIYEFLNYDKIIEKLKSSMKDKAD